MQFGDPTPLVSRIKELNSQLNDIGTEFTLGKNLREQISESYRKVIGRDSKPAAGTTRFFTSDTKWRDESDTVVAKAVITYPLSKLLTQYRNEWKEIASHIGPEWNARAPFPAKEADGEYGGRSRWIAALDKRGHDPENTERLLKFFNYDPSFMKMKGISRPDFSSSALNSCIEDQRSEVLSGICQEVSESINGVIYQQVVELIFQQSLARTKEKYSTNIRNTPFTSALLGKPFLILTGPSGTGKTRTACREAVSLAGDHRCKLVAVGADWTDNRHVLGFLNAITSLPDPSDTTGDGTIPVYETTAILDLILSASGDTGSPYFLILDEMNLSHVERYFADFLSAMELDNKTGALKLHSAGKAVTRGGVIIPGVIDFPGNLFVVGTVNVDETTYMFSPKVLDRATVIEIRADETELKSFLLGTGNSGPASAEANFGISFLEAASVIRNDGDHESVPHLPDTVREEATKHLMELFRIMKHGRFEFGFRTGKEILHSLRAAQFLTGPDEEARSKWIAGGWKSCLDEQILRKILPKLHGSKSRLSPLLGAIATYCETEDFAKAMTHFPVGTGAAKRGATDVIDAAPGKFPNSQKKLREMFRVLNSEQFVSFIC